MKIQFPYIISIILVLLLTGVVCFLKGFPGFLKGVEGSNGNFDNTGGIEFIYIKGGSYKMGSPAGAGENDEHPEHVVDIDPFWIGKYEITQKQFRDIMGHCPGRDRVMGVDYPVYSVKWGEAEEFCVRFGRKYNVNARLPYEAEWEYAARAGSNTMYYWGNKIRNDYCWYIGNSGNRMHPVGRKKPNPWGLYDMLGNVWEWCMDNYGWHYYSSSPGKNPHGPEIGTLRVLRGGSWYNEEDHLRSAKRFGYYPDYRLNLIGFRVVIVP